MNLLDAFRANAMRRPNALAVRTPDELITFAQLDARSDRALSVLREHGVGRGDRVAVQLYNRPEFIELVVALAKAGATLVPLSYFDGDDQVVHVVSDSEAKLLVVDAELQAASIPAAEELGVRSIVVGGSGARSYGSLLDRAGPPGPYERYGDDHELYIGYTSGSTGTPKGVVKDHRSTVQLAFAVGVEWGLRPELVELISMPMCHSGGLWQAMFNLVLGGTASLNRGPAFDPETTLDLLAAWRVGWAILVPTMSDALTAAGGDGDYDHLRVLVSGSAPMFTRTKEGLVDLFPHTELNECYGATETGVVTNLGHVDQLRKTRCVGKPILGVEARVVGDDGQPLPTGDVGEIVARSAFVMRGYHGLAERTAEAIDRDGFVHVGDLGRQDDEGYLYIVDRKHDMIISGGLNVYPAEVEEVLKQHPAVFDAVVVGLPHDRWGEQVTAAVSLGEATSPDELVAFCRRHLPAYKVPKRVAILDQLPKLVSGKNARRLVRETLIVEHERG